MKKIADDLRCGLRYGWLLLPAVLLSMGFLGFSRDKLDADQFVLALEDFKRVCASDPAAAFEQYVEADVQQELGRREAILCPVTDSVQGWGAFFGSAVYTLAPPCGDTGLVLFYHPCSDTALLTVWRLNKGRLAVVDAELFMGDFIRRAGEPMFDPQPYWLRAGAPPVLGLAMAVNATIEAFQRLYGGCGKAAELVEWEKKLANVQDEETMYLNHTAVSLMFERQILMVEELFNSDAARPVARKLEGVIARLADGEAESVLKEADETNPLSAMAVRNLPPAAWRGLAAVSYIDSDQSSLVMLSPAGGGDQVYGLLFDRNRTGVRLRRIEAIDFHAAYQNRRQIAEIAEGGER